MANPNIVNLTNILGKTELINLSTTSATQVLTNAASSGKVLKINSIYVTNIDGTNAANITINLYDQAAMAGNAFPIASTISVPANSSLVVVERNAGIYIMEDKSIGAIASAANDLVVICSYEDIS
tara:strand:- start:1144 stop:1518 length:375 start_codon:yes stop_codon:yes gene_type:complete